MRSSSRSSSSSSSARSRRHNPSRRRGRPSGRSQAPAQEDARLRRRRQQAVAPKAAPGAEGAPATAAAPYGEVRTACATEIKGTCAGVVPGSAESVQCLRPNFSVLYSAMPGRVSRASAGDGAAGRGRRTPNPTHPPAPPTRRGVVSTDRITQPEGVKESAAPDLKLPAMRPTQEARWVNRNCKEDHSLLCQGVTFGQSRVLRCLLVASFVADQGGLQEGAGEALTAHPAAPGARPAAGIAAAIGRSTYRTGS